MAKEKTKKSKNKKKAVYSGIGGQAVLEGIMMKNKNEYSVAVRKPDGTIEVQKWDIEDSFSNRYAFARWPFVRGVVNFVESLSLGMKTLTYSSSFYEEDEAATKGDQLLEKAFELGCEYIVTGHYAVVEYDEKSGLHLLRKAADEAKDQSYFLCQLSQKQLEKAMFPIGDICKPEVRRIAHEAGLPSADKKDSQGICFVGKVDLPVFLQQKLKSREGDVIEISPDFYKGRRQPQSIEEKAEPIIYRREDGKPAGRHIGAQYYTIGQRKGLNLGGHAEPVFLIANDIENNLIYIGQGRNHPGLYREALRITPEEVHWIRPDKAMEPGEERRYRVRIRYRQPLQKATLICKETGMYILFDEPQRGITPGQFAVWYAEDGEMLGSGVINR